MKVKTEWGKIFYGEGAPLHWINKDGIAWEYFADTRWLNCYGLGVHDVELKPHSGREGKIIGDPD